MQINAGEIYRNHKTGDDYIVVDPKCVFKNPVSREWVGAVAYCAKGDSVMCVRETSEFMVMFEKIGFADLENIVSDVQYS